MGCDSPYQTRTKNLKGEDVHLDFPCGKCVSCKQRIVSQWCFRLQVEDRHASSSYFITLTYDNYNLPRSENNYPTLLKKDVQLFMKRLRKKQKRKIRYYAVGEYGSDHDRPHYHIIMFNLEGCQQIGYSENGYMEYTNNNVNKAWNKGGVNIRSVGGENIAYTLKYIDKEKRVPLHSKDDRQKEFSLKSIGLGNQYVENEEIQKWHSDNISRNYAVSPTGYKVALPKSWRHRLYTEQERELQREIAIAKEEEKEEERARRYREHVKDGSISLEYYIFTEKEAKHTKFYNNQKQKRNGIKDH